MSRKLQIKTNTEQIEIVDEHGNSRGMIEIAKSDINLIGRHYFLLQFRKHLWFP